MTNTAIKAKKEKRCKQCKRMFRPFQTTQKVCGIKCAMAEGEDQKLRLKHQEERRNRQAVNELKRRTLRWQHKQTQKRFNRMRVLQELKWFRVRNIEPYCISCGKTEMDWCCGHYKTVGSSGDLRYSEVNTNLQCNRYCNMGLSGNISGNKNTIGYTQGLIERFGDERAGEIFEACERKSTAEWTCGQLERMRKGFNKSIRELEGELD